MKILFLDIDGVLVTGKFSREQYDVNQWERDEFGDAFDPDAVAQLARIIAETGCEIVISSTWRMSGESVMLDLWNKRKLPGKVVGITEVTRHGIRGAEVTDWLLKNSHHPALERDERRNKPGDVETYCILDDDSDFLIYQASHFVRTPPENGLTKKKADKVIAILNSPAPNPEADPDEE